MADDDSFNAVYTGSSFLGIQNIGSAQCLLDHGNSTLSNRVQRYGGSSSGALVASVMATVPGRLQDFLYEIYGLVDDISKRPNGAISEGYDLINSIREILDKILPPDAHSLATNRLFVSVTELVPANKYVPLGLHDVDQGTSSSLNSKGLKVFENFAGSWEIGQSGTISVFENREDLIQALLGSIYVPWFKDWTSPKWKGKNLIDTHLAQKSNLPEEIGYNFPGGELLRITPDPKNHAAIRDKISVGWMDTSGQRFEISPLNMFRVGNGLFSPPKQYLETYYADGYEDATRFLKFYHAYEENDLGFKPRKTKYSLLHSVEDLSPL